MNERDAKSWLEAKRLAGEMAKRAERAKGALAAAKKSLENKHGVKSVKEGRIKLAKAETRLGLKRKQLAKDLEAFRVKWKGKIE